MKGSYWFMVASCTHPPSRVIPFKGFWSNTWILVHNCITGIHKIGLVHFFRQYCWFFVDRSLIMGLNTIFQWLNTSPKNYATMQHTTNPSKPIVARTHQCCRQHVERSRGWWWVFLAAGSGSWHTVVWGWKIIVG